MQARVVDSAAIDFGEASDGCRAGKAQLRRLSKRNYVDLVFEGGGVNGIGLAGAYSVLAIIDYIKAMAQTMMEAHDRLYVQQAQWARTIPIKTLGVGTTEFEITRERALRLYDSGRKATEEFVETWDFGAYKALFRAGKAIPTRQEGLVQQLAEAQVGTS